MLFLIIGFILFYGGRFVISSYGGALIFNHSISMDEHKFSLERAALCVPKAYFRFSNSFYSNSSIGLDLSMEINSFEPWNVYGERVGFFASKKSMARQEVNKILSNEVGLSISDNKGGAINEKWKFLLKDVRMHQEEKYTRLLPGKGAVTYYDYFLTPKGAKDYSYIIGCVSGGKCGLESSYNEFIKYKVIFDEKHLDIVGEIDSRSREFIRKHNCID